MRRCGLSTGQRHRAEHVNAVWSWDFVTDQAENGTTFRILTLIDEYSRRLLAVHVAWPIRAVDVIAVVKAAMARYGNPGHIRSDNGPDFIANAVQEWLAGEQIQTLYITPGSPWENGHIESFHDKLRDEGLPRQCGSKQQPKVQTNTGRTSSFDVSRFWGLGRARGSCLKAAASLMRSRRYTASALYTRLSVRDTDVAPVLRTRIRNLKVNEK